MTYERRYSSEAPKQITNINAQVEASYTHARGTEIVHIQDELLTNDTVTQDRAEAELLNQGYKEKVLTIETYHIDQMKVGSLIEVSGVIYKVTSVTDNVAGVKASMTITMKRWV
jgi:hypothetical protein